MRAEVWAGDKWSKSIQMTHCTRHFGKKNGLSADRCFWFRTWRVHGYDRFVSRSLRHLMIAPVVVRRLQWKKSGTSGRRCKATIQTTSPYFSMAQAEVEGSKSLDSMNVAQHTHAHQIWLAGKLRPNHVQMNPISHFQLVTKLARPLSNIRRKKYVNPPNSNHARIIQANRTLSGRKQSQRNGTKKW